MANQVIYEDGKYCIQDFATLFLGTKFRRGEIFENEEIPFKFRLVVERYLSEHWNETDTLEEFLFHLKDDFAAKIFKQLKAKIRVNILEDKKDRAGNMKQEYVTKTYTAEEFVKIDMQLREDQKMIVQELSVSKLALMGF